MSAFKDSFWGSGGFEELRKYMKQGNEFCKELAVVMQERVDLENTYAKGLLRLGLKLNKSASTCIGTLASAWALVATEMESEAEVRRNVAMSLYDEIYKPLKSFTESQYRGRKPLTQMVDKMTNNLSEKRSEENKGKKAAFSNAKDAEKVFVNHVSENEARSGGSITRGKSLSEKDFTKLEKKLRSLEGHISKADSDYHENCLKAECARQDWEMAVYNTSSQLQVLEEERFTELKSYLSKYCSSLLQVPSKIMQSCDRLKEATLVVDVVTDLAKIIETKGTGPNVPEQILFDSYAEDFNHAMDADRRQKSLLNNLLYFQQDLEKEQKAKRGVEKLIEAYQNRPDFADKDTMYNSKQKLQYTKATINYLDACHYKLQCAIAKLNKKPKPDHRLTPFIQHLKDKQGHELSILRLPLHLAYQGLPNLSPIDQSAHYRESGDGGRDPDPRPVSEFYDEDEFDTYDGACDGNKSPSTCTASAVYAYEASQQDELTLSVGDVVTVYEQGADGWWRGECNGAAGHFPASYVQVTR